MTPAVVCTVELSMLERTVAHTNRAVSTPSRPTATTAIQTTPQPELPAERDLDSDPSSSPLSSRAFFPIQKIIQVTMPTATKDRVPPRISWAWKVRVLGPQVMMAPATSGISAASPTPSHSLGRASRRSALTR